MDIAKQNKLLDMEKCLTNIALKYTTSNSNMLSPYLVSKPLENTTPEPKQQPVQNSYITPLANSQAPIAYGAIPIANSLQSASLQPQSSNMYTVPIAYTQPQTINAYSAQSSQPIILKPQIPINCYQAHVSNNNNNVSNVNQYSQPYKINTDFINNNSVSETDKLVRIMFGRL